MHKRTRGFALLVCLLIVGCSCTTNETHGVHSTSQDLSTATSSSAREKTLMGLEDQMGLVALERKWSGKYFPASTVQGATISGKDLFAWTFNGQTRQHELHSLSATTGIHQWMVGLGEVGLEYPPGAGDRFVVGILQDGQGMVVVDRRTGARQFRMRTKIEQIPTGPPASSSSSVYVASLVDDRLHSIDPDEGLSGWGWRTEGTLVAGPTMTPKLPRSLVVVGTDAGEVIAISPAGWNERRPESPAWRRKLFGDVNGDLNIAERTADGRLEVSVLVPCEDRGLYCLDAATGEPRWVHRTESAFLAAREFGDRVFGRNTTGMHVIDLGTGEPSWGGHDHDSGTIAWQTARDAVAADDKRAYLVGENKRIMRVNGKTGTLEEERSLDSFDWVLPSGNSNLLIGLTRDGNIVAFY